MHRNASIFKTKLQLALRQLPYLPRAAALVWHASRRWSAAWAMLLLIQGVLPLATVYLTKNVVDTLVAATRSNAQWSAVRPALIWICALAAVMVVGELFSVLTHWVRTAVSDLVQDHITNLIHEKSAAVDYAFYESPDYYDRLHRARSEATYRPIALLDNFGSLIQNSITLIAMAAVLVPFGLWLPAALLLSTIPACYVVIRSVLQQYRWRLQTTSDERRGWYYDWLLTASETAAELRLFALGSHFRSTYQSLRHRLRTGRLQLTRRQAFAQLAAGAFGLLITAASLAWMVRRAVLGRATLGDLALFYQAFAQGQRLMRTLLENLGQLFANCLFIGNLFEFLDLEPQIVDPPSPTPPPAHLTDGIRFSHVSFKYPGSDRVALHDFNLHIPAGQIAAFVGPNGAGKTTLIKLLCRLYDPAAGQIELDGIDLRDMPVADLRRRFAVLFQDPVHYNNTVAQNIAFGDLSVPGSSPAIRHAALAAGADPIIRTLPDGYASLLGKSFVQGTELSGGQWQRLALARAFLRQSPVILLDEPTSAMDSWAETDWLSRLRTLAAGRTVIIITHRFTTAMQADIIHVLDNGQIIESGRHDELISASGPYAHSWASQLAAAQPS